MGHKDVASRHHPSVEALSYQTSSLRPGAGETAVLCIYLASSVAVGSPGKGISLVVPQLTVVVLSSDMSLYPC